MRTKETYQPSPFLVLSLNLVVIGFGRLHFDVSKAAVCSQGMCVWALAATEHAQSA